MEKKTIVVVAVMVAVIVVGIAAAVGGIVWFVFKATAPPVEAVRAHLAAINQGDYARAYTYLHVSVQQQMPIAEVQGYVPTKATAGSSQPSASATSEKTRSKPRRFTPGPAGSIVGAIRGAAVKISHARVR